MLTHSLLSMACLRWGTYTGSSSGSVPGAFGMGSCQKAKRPCLAGRGIPMVMPPGRRGLGCSCHPETTGLWATGYQRSGPHSRRNRGGLGPWRPLREGPGPGSWLGIGPLCVGWMGVGCVGAGVAGWGELAVWVLILLRRCSFG